MSPRRKEVDKALSGLTNIKKAKNKNKIDDKGEISDYLGINFDQQKDRSLKLWQPHLIDQILEEVGVTDQDRIKPTPAAMGFNT